METLAGCSPQLLIGLVGKQRVEGDSGEAAAANCFFHFHTDRAAVTYTTATNQNTVSSRAHWKELLLFRMNRIYSCLSQMVTDILL